MNNYLLHFSNTLSMLRIICAPITALLLIFGKPHFLLALILFTIASSTDFFDGYFARKYNIASAFGAFLDPLADKILVVTVLFAFYKIGTIELWVVILIALRDIMVTSLRIFSISQGFSLYPTNAAKLKTVLQFIFIYFLFFLAWDKVGNTWHTVATYLLYSIVGFTAWTGITYGISARQVIKKWFF